jgi:hypothetical protein
VATIDRRSPKLQQKNCAKRRSEEENGLN